MLTEKLNCYWKAKIRTIKDNFGHQTILLQQHILCCIRLNQDEESHIARFGLVPKG